MLRSFSLLHLPDTSKDIGFNVNHWVHDLLSLALAVTVLVLGTSVISTLQGFFLQIASSTTSVFDDLMVPMSGAVMKTVWNCYPQ